MSDQTDTASTVLVGEDLLRQMGLRKILAEDYRIHKRELLRPGLHALFFYRIGVWARTIPRPWRWPVTLVHLIGFYFCRNVYGIELRRTVKIGRRFEIGHQHGIVIHLYATFGDDCTVRQGVTLGITTEDGWQRGVGPVIGNNVTFSPGCIVIGNIRIGDNVQIGPNCVVSADVPANRILFVPPPRILPREMSEDRAATAQPTQNEVQN